MNAVDRYLQTRRIGAARRWIHPGGHVLDVGCADGALFRSRGFPAASGVGIEPQPSDGWVAGPFERRIGTFPGAVQEGETFDTVVMLAVVEHVAVSALHEWGAALPAMLRPGGRVVVTVPSPSVDHILVLGKRLHVLDGMEIHEHHGFDAEQVPHIFSGPRLHLIRARRFELGLNHLFVFSSTA